MLLFIILTFILEIGLSSSSCVQGENFCITCNKLTDLCAKCSNSQILVPDKIGGCTGSQKCKVGKNNCDECDEDKKLCLTCTPGYFPDNNGGCSFSANCEVSNFGVCLQCTENFIFIEDLKLCKSLEADDFKNCEEINYSNGLCSECEEEYYLNEGDHKCSETEYCFESIYGQCQACKKGYYLDLKDNKSCKKQEKKLLHCKESEDGKACSKCDDGYYFDEDDQCVNTNYCAKSENFKCTKCVDNYYLTKSLSICVNTKNCNYGDPDTGICWECLRQNYFDLNDGGCKSNQEDDDLKYCLQFSDKCDFCELTSFMGEDGHCSKSKNCAKAESGVCTKCSKNYYLGKDNRCTDVENCITSDIIFNCEECDKGFVLDSLKEECIEAKGSLKNCKTTVMSDNTKCKECKEGFDLVESEEEEGESTCVASRN